METARLAPSLDIEKEQAEKRAVIGKEAPGYVLLLYTLLFAVTAAGVYLFFAVKHCSLLWMGDGLHQLFPKMVKTKVLLGQLLASDFPFWLWDNGLGTDTMAIFRSSLLDPTVWIACLFPLKHLDLGYSLAVFLKLYAAGITFLCFARKVGFNVFQQLTGSISYAFCAWMLIVSLSQGHLLISAAVFPLVILGMEKLHYERRPVLFCISVMLQVIYSTYFAYMVAIMVVIYFLVRWFSDRQGKGIAAFVREFLAFLGYGLLGIAMSAAISISSLYGLFNVSTETGKNADLPILYSPHAYWRLLDSFLTGCKFESYSWLVFPGILLVLLPVLVLGARAKRTGALMGLLCLFMALFPCISSLFNGGSYVTGRWFFMLYFFVVYGTVDCMAMERLRERKTVWIMTGWLIVLTVSFLLAWHQGIHSNNEKLYGCFTLFFAVIGILLLQIRQRILRSVLLMACLLCNIAACNNVQYLYLKSSAFKPYQTYMKWGSPYRMFQRAVQNTSKALPQEGFYRVDQVTGVIDSAVTRIPYNEGLYTGERSVSTYLSTIDKSWQVFNAQIGNNAGLVRRAYVFSNDNRAAVDTLMGVKYYLGNSRERVTQGSLYAPYGFRYLGKNKGTDVFENTYAIGIGTVFHKCIAKSDFDTLPYAQRDQALLQALVVTDKQYASMKASVRATTDDLQLDAESVPYTAVSSEGASIKDRKIIVTDKENKITLSVDGAAADSQIMVSFDNLIKDRQKADPTKKNKEFMLDVSNGIIVKRAMNNVGHPQGVPDVEDYNINLGYQQNWDGTITLQFDQPGEYSFDSLKIMASPNTSYDALASSAEQNSLENVQFSDTRVQGRCRTAQDGLVFLNIPYAPGWQITVDGRKAEVIRDADFAFTAVAVPKGEHKITATYRYPGIRYGIPISAAAVLILLFFTRRAARRRQA